MLSDDQKRISWLFERHLWLKACGAIECKGCGSAVKIRQGTRSTALPHLQDGCTWIWHIGATDRIRTS